MLVASDLLMACSDLSHHLMGRWHYEMAQLNVMVRTLIRMAFSTNLPPGTNQDALKCYQQAAKLNPTCVAHHVEIGRCLSKMGRRKEAAEALKVSVACCIPYQLGNCCGMQCLCSCSTAMSVYWSSRGAMLVEIMCSHK